MDKFQFKNFEDIIRRNVLTIQDYSKDTRKLVRAQEKEVEHLKKLVMSKDAEIATLKQQVATIFQKLYQEGS